MIIKHVVMDVDGTIFNTMPIYGKIFAEILYEKCKISKEESWNFYKNSAGTPVVEQFRTLLKHHNLDENLAPQMREELFRFGDVDVPLFSEAREAIKFLAIRRELSLFASSGTQTHVLYSRFRKAEVFDYFEMILGSDVIPKSAVHIEIFAIAKRVLRKDFAARAVYVGDGPQDMKIAKECGIKAIGVATTVSAAKLRENGADAVIKELNTPELREVLISFNKQNPEIPE
jgi:phosphoglycolate phosphatase